MFLSIRKKKLPLGVVELLVVVLDIINGGNRCLIFFIHTFHQDSLNSRLTRRGSFSCPKSVVEFFMDLAGHRNKDVRWEHVRQVFRAGHLDFQVRGRRDFHYSLIFLSLIYNGVRFFLQLYAQVHNRCEEGQNNEAENGHPCDCRYRSDRRNQIEAVERTKELVSLVTKTLIGRLGPQRYRNPLLFKSCCVVY